MLREPKNFGVVMRVENHFQFDAIRSIEDLVLPHEV
jgi:hypothetical protein